MLWSGSPVSDAFDTIGTTFRIPPLSSLFLTLAIAADAYPGEAPQTRSQIRFSYSDVGEGTFYEMIK